MTTKVLEDKFILVEEDVGELRQGIRILSEGLKELALKMAGDEGRITVHAIYHLSYNNVKSMYV